jgi:hypothetical protein
LDCVSCSGTHHFHCGAADDESEVGVGVGADVDVDDDDGSGGGGDVKEFRFKLFPVADDNDLPFVAVLPVFLLPPTCGAEEEEEAAG